MNKCIICGKECKGECCSGACRAKKSRTRTPVKRTVVSTDPAHGEDKSVEITAEIEGDEMTIVDCKVIDEPISDYDRLESWAEGNGTEHQYRLGMLARHYRALYPVRSIAEAVAGHRSTN